MSQPLGSSLTISSEADWEWVEIKLISGAIKKFSVCIFYSVFAHFIHININRSTREHIKNNICAILNSYNKDGSGKFWATFSRRNVPKSHCIIGVKGMHVSAFDGFSQKSFFDRIRTQLVLWMHWSLFLCKTNKNYLRTRACPQMIVHLARQDPCWWRVESLRVFAGSVLQTIPTKWWSAPPWQIVSSQERAVFGVFSCFFFFAAAGCCLVGNLVAPLLDGLNDL